MCDKDIMNKIIKGLDIVHSMNIPVKIKLRRQSNIITDEEVILYQEDSPEVWMKTIHSVLKNKGIFWWSSEAETLKEWNEILKSKYSND